MAAKPAPQSNSTTPQHDFHRSVLEHLQKFGIPYLVGGGYSLEQYTGIRRDSKDLDLVVRPEDAGAVLGAFAHLGYRTELCFPHWLAKVFGEEYVVDIIFSSGNGICRVDDEWFHHSVPGKILGIDVNLCPAEELIWAKAYIMERERYDGADIAHMIRARGAQLDWPRLLRRFEADWQVLLSHLILFDFIYPSERKLVPAWVMNELLNRLGAPENRTPAAERICRGTLLSRSQYRADVENWGYKDARHLPDGSMTAEEASNWSNAGEHQAHGGKSPAA